MVQGRFHRTPQRSFPIPILPIPAIASASRTLTGTAPWHRRRTGTIPARTRTALRVETLLIPRLGCWTLRKQILALVELEVGWLFSGPTAHSLEIPGPSGWGRITTTGIRLTS